jgi:hypothetical protein
MHDRFPNAKRGDTGLRPQTKTTQSPPVSYLEKKFLETISESEYGRVFVRHNNAIHVESELLPEDFKTQCDQDSSRRIKRARMSVLLKSPERVFLWWGGGSCAEVLPQISLRSPILTQCLSADLPDRSPET